MLIHHLAPRANRTKRRKQDRIAGELLQPTSQLTGPKQVQQDWWMAFSSRPAWFGKLIKSSGKTRAPCRETVLAASANRTQLPPSGYKQVETSADIRMLRVPELACLLHQSAFAFAQYLWRATAHAVAAGYQHVLQALFQ